MLNELLIKFEVILIRIFDNLRNLTDVKLGKVIQNSSNTKPNPNNCYPSSCCSS